MLDTLSFETHFNTYFASRGFNTKLVPINQSISNGLHIEPWKLTCYLYAVNSDSKASLRIGSPYLDRDFLFFLSEKNLDNFYLSVCPVLISERKKLRGCIDEIKWSVSKEHLFDGKFNLEQSCSSYDIFLAIFNETLRPAIHYITQKKKSS